MSSFVNWVYLQENRSHPLVLLQQSFDFTAIVQQCAHYRKETGTPGSNDTYSVEQLLRIEFIRAWKGGLSDGELVNELRQNAISRWFVGIHLTDPVPSDTTIQRFNAWIRQHHPDALFCAVHHFLDTVDPSSAETNVMQTDTFGMRTPATPQEPAVVLMRVMAYCMELWDAFLPEMTAILPDDINHDALRTARAARSKEKAIRQLRYTVRDARRVQAAITPYLSRLTTTQRDDIQRYLNLIDKVIADETTTDDAGLVIERPNTKRGTYRLMSMHDMDATFRKHGIDPAVLGYNVGIIASTTRIWAIAALTGATPDNDTSISLIRLMQKHGFQMPNVIVGDQAYGHGKTRAQVAAITHGATQLVARIPQAGGADRQRFTPTDFTITSWDADRCPVACRCPNNVVSTFHYESGTGDGVKFRFTATDCAGCPLWNECRKPGAHARGNREVFISAYHSTVRAAARFNATDEGQALLKDRWRIEATIAWITRYNGGRVARCVGQVAAQYQCYQAAAVRNLQLWLARVARGAAPPPAIRGPARC
jgi:hypothetical protein